VCVCSALLRRLELLVVNKRLQQPTRSLSLAAVAHFLIHVCMSEPSQTSQTSQNSDGWCRGPDATVLPPIRRQSGDVVVHPSLRSILVTAVSQERPAADFFKCGTWCWWPEVKGHYALTKHKSRRKIWQFHTSISWTDVNCYMTARRWFEIIDEENLGCPFFSQRTFLLVCLKKGNFSTIITAVIQHYIIYPICLQLFPSLYSYGYYFLILYYTIILYEYEPPHMKASVHLC